MVQIANMLLPNGWIQCSFGDILFLKNGYAFKSSCFVKQGVPVVRISDIQEGGVKTENAVRIQSEDIYKDYQIEKDDILIAMSGATTGKFGIYRSNDKSYQNQRVGNLKLYSDKLICKKYVYYLLYVCKDQIEIDAYGGAQPNISGKRIEAILIPLPPLAEQYRIVAKLEELFSDLDAAVGSLQAARDQLKVYRQAVLKSAFEGKLTERWRQENRDKLEPAETLLARIRTERQDHYRKQVAEWEKQTAAWEANGKKGKKPARPIKIKEVAPLTKEELAKLPELPEGWGWVKVGDCTLGVEYGTSAKSKESGDVPVVRMGNIQNGKIDWTDLVYSDDKQEIEKYMLKKNDVLFNRTNSPELVGKTAIFRGGRDAIFAGYLIRVNQIDDMVNPDYLNYYLNSIVAKNHGNKVKTDGVNQSNINGEKLKQYPFPYALREEQNQVVGEIESRLSVCEKLEEAIEDGLKKAELMRQSILKRAFEGKLVEQNLNDEPAEELLKRIKKGANDV